MEEEEIERMLANKKRDSTKVSFYRKEKPLFLGTYQITTTSIVVACKSR